MSANPSLYADAFSQSGSPAATFSAASTRLSLSRALTQDLATYFHERAQLEDAYVKSLHKLLSRLHGQAKDSVFRELDLVATESERQHALGAAWNGVRRTLENEVDEVARVHETWRKKVSEEVEGPLRASLNKGDWTRWSQQEGQLAGSVKEYEGLVDKVQKAQSKSTRSGKSASSKLLTSQSHLSTLGSSLTSTLPSFLSATQALDLSHSAFLKEALVRCGTATSDLGRARMEAGETLLVQVLGVDESAEAEEWALKEGMRLGGGAAAAATFGAGASGGGASEFGGRRNGAGEFGEHESVSSASHSRTPRDRQETQSDVASTRSASIAPSNAGVERSRTMSTRAPPAGPIALPTSGDEDRRSTKEKTGLGGKLSSLLGGGKSRDRSSSIPNSAKYANFAAAPDAPPVPSPSASSSQAQAPQMERRDTAASGGSDLLGGSSAGGPPPLQPSASGGAEKRKSLMPGGAGSLFRRQSKMSSLNDYDAPASSPPAQQQQYGQQGQFSPEIVAEPANASPQVDSEGFSVPPEGYDRAIGAGAGGNSNLMDDDDEPLGDIPSSVPRLSIAPSLPAPGSPSLPQESEAERLAALEAVKNSLGAPAGGLSRRVTARGRRSETGARNTVYGAPGGSGGLEPPQPVREGSVSDDDVPLAVVQQQQQSTHRRAPPPPPSAGSKGTSPPLPATPSSPGTSFVPPSPAGISDGRAMSVLSASSSLAASTILARPDPFASATTPGVRAEVRETVNVLLKNGEVTRVMVSGEVGVSWRPSSAAGVEGVTLRLPGLDSAEKTAPNAAFLAPSPSGQSGSFTLLPALAAREGTTPILKYQLSLPVSGPGANAVVPLTLKPSWRCEPGLARVILAYSVNAASPLLTAAESPFGGEGEPAQVEDVTVSLHLGGGATASSFQAKPALAALLPGGKGLAFTLPALSAAKAGAEEKLLASIQTEGTAQPTPVAVSWSVKGRTVGAVGVEVEGEGEEVVELRRETVSGKYLAA
ncbi:hypothetical protein JCM10207_008598 [Rhodosporidiobolus poonsookiae]